MPGPAGPAGPTTISAEAGNIARLGTDSFVYVPDLADVTSIVPGNSIEVDVTDPANPIIGLEQPAFAGLRAGTADAACFKHISQADIGYMAQADGSLAVIAAAQAQIYVDTLLKIAALPASVWLYGVATGQWVTIASAVQAVAMAVQSNYDSLANDWSAAHFVAYSPNATARISFSGTAGGGSYVSPQMRVNGASGTQIDVVNEAESAFAAISASAFPIGSSISTKRDVRSLSEDVAHPAATADPASDVMPTIDVMALRPVVFRPNVGISAVVPADPDVAIDINDPTTWTYAPAEGIIGAEGDRERLGLIAEEVQSVIPSAVTHDIDGNAKGVDYAQVTAALLDHVQRLTERIAVLEAAV